MASARRVVDVRSDNTDLQSALLLENSEKPARPLVEAFNVCVEFGFAQAFGAQVQCVHRAGIGQPTRQAIGCIIRFHSADQIFTAVDSDVSLEAFQIRKPDVSLHIGAKLSEQNTRRETFYLVQLPCRRPHVSPTRGRPSRRRRTSQVYVRDRATGAAAQRGASAIKPSFRC